MSKYQVTRRSLRHRQGSKEYHFLLIENTETGVALAALRWGKAGSWGQMQVHVGNRNAMTHLVVTKTHEKEKGGYNQSVNNVTGAGTAAEVKKLATVTYWAKLGADNLKKVIPDADTTGVREQTPVEFDENANGTFSAKHTVKQHPDFVEDEAKKAEREEAQAREKQKVDPLWGMF